MPRRPPPGSIVAIDLGQDGFAVGRVLRDASIAVLRGVWRRPSDRQPRPDDILFTVGIYDADLASLKVIAHEAFATPEDEWPPPYAVKDPITGDFELYHRGSIIPVPPGVDPRSLEPAAVWTLAEIRDRILASAR